MHSDAQKKPIPCFIWILAILSLGAGLWYLLYSYVTAQKALTIQDDLNSRSGAALATQADMVNVSALANGRDILLAGTVASEQVRLQAEQITLQVNGVRDVNNTIKIADMPAPEIAVTSEYEFRSSAKVESLPDEFPLLEEDQNIAEIAPQDLAAARQSIDNMDLNNISFVHGSATLTENASSTLSEIATTLNQHKNVGLRVEGHTDNTGDPNYNLDLSTKRAQSVVDYLVAVGIENTRLVAEGFGDQQPIATNDTKEGRSKNRRIEFKLINGEH